MSIDVDAVVIGSGVIGLSAARALSLAGVKTLVLERDWQIGTGISSRNSEVIHAGIYYPAGTLKAQTCIRGRELIYDFCMRHGVAHRRCGKLIVAVDQGQLSELQFLSENSEENGVRLIQLTRDQARRMESQLQVEGALYSPNTGIIDSHSYLTALLGEAEAYGAQLVCRTNVTKVSRFKNSWAITIHGEQEPTVRTRWVINAAGLDAHSVALRIEGITAGKDIWYAKGSYFTLHGHCPFYRLIYPLPEAGGLGIHLTLDLSGRARFGPDVEWVDQPSFTVDPMKRGRFADSIRRWWPALEAERLAPDFAGVRPKLRGPAEPSSDFQVEGPIDHGLPDLINLYGIESPGLTASLALGERICSIVLGD